MKDESLASKLEAARNEVAAMLLDYLKKGADAMGPYEKYLWPKSSPDIYWVKEQKLIDCRMGYKAIEGQLQHAIKERQAAESRLEAIDLGLDVEYDNRGANALALRMLELIDDKEPRLGVFGGELIEKLAQKIEALKANQKS